MPWPPPFASRRFALVVYGLALMAYIMLTGMFTLAGLDPRAVVIAAQLIGILGLSLWLARLMGLPLAEAFSLRSVEGEIHREAIWSQDHRRALQRARTQRRDTGRVTGCGCRPKGRCGSGSNPPTERGRRECGSK